ncbi:hypothetical protein [Actinomadura rifamycini]|uniref:hypothetical protein n=1 Tax=Actinomadura rifamycini TaxID=31962 RepID=UPI0003F8AAE3|nr:hypothetical protein [Actinomadura rifamycini]
MRINGRGRIHRNDPVWVLVAPALDAHTGDLPNGGFAIARDDLLAGRLDRIERVRPAG